LYADLGLCHPSPPTITKQAQKEQYLANIRRLKLFLSGKTKQVARELTTQMRQASKAQDFETAALLRDQLSAIEALLTRPPSVATYLQSDVLAPHLPNLQVQAVARLLHTVSARRIEGYDIANLGGRLATASLVVFENGRPNPDQYRRFKVRLPESPNDPAMMRHVLARRFNHPEWELPQVILIDGGKAQVGAIRQLIATRKLPAIQLVGLAKREETLVIPASTQDRKWDLVELPPEDPALTLLKAVRDEAHRFATTYHKLLRLKHQTQSKNPEKRLKTLTRVKPSS
jgi:excinuclease ABC subunit C